jgi:hypothetical protein
VAGTGSEDSRFLAALGMTNFMGLERAARSRIPRLAKEARHGAPIGQTGVYDVGVDKAGRLQRVQVKSTIYRRRSGEYSLNVMGPQRKKYAPGTVDFFAVLLVHHSV